MGHPGVTRRVPAPSPISRNGRDHIRRFLDIAAAVAKLSALPPVRRAPHLHSTLEGEHIQGLISVPTYFQARVCERPSTPHKARASRGGTSSSSGSTARLNRMSPAPARRTRRPGVLAIGIVT